MGLYVMIVEFIGLPASGKSTLAKEVYSTLKSKYKVIYPLKLLYSKNWFIRNFIKAFRVFKYITRNFKLSLEILMAVKLTNQKYTMDILRLSFNFLFFLSTIAIYQEKQDIVIFDEGFIHHTWAIMVNANNEESYSILEKIMPDIDILITVDNSLDTICYRMKQRTKLSNRHKGFIDNIHLIYEKMVKTKNYFIENNYIKCYLSLKNETQTDLKVAIEKINKIISDKL